VAFAAKKISFDATRFVLADAADYRARIAVASALFCPFQALF
jgi:hypothetical protein